MEKTDYECGYDDGYERARNDIVAILNERMLKHSDSLNDKGWLSRFRECSELKTIITGRG